MSIYKKYLQQLIQEELSRVLSEQDLPEDPAKKPTTDTPTADTEPLDMTSGAETADPNLGDAVAEVPAGTDPNASPDLGGDLGGAGGLDTMDGAVEGEDGIEDIGDTGGGGGFGGGFGGGGGFSFGDSGDEGLNPDDEAEEETGTTVGPEDVEMPDDPVMAIADEAINMLKTTRQPSVILKTVKSSIQRYFNDFEDATPVIKALWDSEDVVLRDVARRLLLFIRGI